MDPHADSTEIAYLSGHELAERLAAGELTSVDLVTRLRERIARVEGDERTRLRAVAALDDTALAAARERDEERRAGELRGALHGLPVVIKDSIEAIGLPTAAGSTALRRGSSRDAELVTRLRDAGAVILASTNLSQWANLRSPRSTSGWSATGGLVANPWALDRSAGGSSSGTGAALAAGYAPFGVGTETDGSIVCPSSLNGVVGLKPTVGRVPTQGVVPISASQDSPGPMARTVRDVETLYGVLSATEPPPHHRSRHGAPPRFAVAANWRTGHPGTDQRFDEFVDQLVDAGYEVHRRDLAEPGPEQYDDELTVLLCELHDDLSAYLAERPGAEVRSLADVVAHEETHPATELAHFGHEYFTTALARGGRASDDYGTARARNLAWAVQSCLAPGLAEVDAILAPAWGPAWKSDLVTGGHPGAASVATTPAAIAGWPIMSVPLGLVADLPVGAALVGRANDEWTLLGAAHVVEAVVALETPGARPGWRTPTRG